MKISTLSPWVIPGLIKGDEAIIWSNKSLDKFINSAIGYSRESLSEDDRRAELVSVRRAVIYFFRKRLRLPVKDIGAFINRHYSNAIYQYGKMEELKSNGQLNDIEITTLDKLEMALKTFNKNHCPQN